MPLASDEGLAYRSSMLILLTNDDGIHADAALTVDGGLTAAPKP